jgi:hypothetical protein
MKHVSAVYTITLVLVILLDLLLLYNNHKQRKQNDVQTAIQKSNYNTLQNAVMNKLTT